MSVPDLDIYFGRAGQLRRLFNPSGGMLATRNLGTTVFPTGSGGARVQRALDATRQYSLNYGALGRVNFDWLDTFRQGHFGVGPFVFLDPGRRNLLTSNQSSATSASNDTRQFTVTGVGGALSSVSSLSTPFPRVLGWTFSTTTPAAARVVLDKPSSIWPGLPVWPRPYTFWCMVLGAASTVDFTLQIEWLDLAGSILSTVTSSTFTTSLTNWQMVSCRATVAPPANTCWMRVSVNPVVATIAAGDVIYMSSFMVNEGDQPDNQWAPGTGVYPVQIVSLPEQYGFAHPDMTVSPTLVLQEVK
jgi:hypothetical protein